MIVSINDCLNLDMNKCDVTKMCLANGQRTASCKNCPIILSTCLSVCMLVFLFPVFLYHFESYHQFVCCLEHGLLERCLLGHVSGSELQLHGLPGCGLQTYGFANFVLVQCSFIAFVIFVQRFV